MQRGYFKRGEALQWNRHLNKVERVLLGRVVGHEVVGVVQRAELGHDVFHNGVHL